MRHVPHLGDVDVVAQNDWQAEKRGKIAPNAFTPAIADFYLSNPIARASALMAELSQGAAQRRASPMAAE